jgi:hypothetical protein
MARFERCPPLPQTIPTRGLEQPGITQRSHRPTGRGRSPVRQNNRAPWWRRLPLRRYDRPEESPDLQTFCSDPRLCEVYQTPQALSNGTFHAFRP